jgi:hypothetical protein
MLKSIFSSVLRKPDAKAKTSTQFLGEARPGERVTVFTTVHAAGFAKYGENFISSFLANWPDNYDLWLYGEGFDLEAPSSRIKFIDLDSSIPALSAFKKRHALNMVTHGQLKGGYNYRFDAVRFANKAYVMCDVFRKQPSRHVIWLDADTTSFLPVPVDLVDRILADGEFMGYLGRMGMHSETGFLPFDLGHSGASAFFEAVEAMYNTDTVLSLAEWHDCQVIDTVRATLQAQSVIRSRNLNAFNTGHPFVNSVAGLFMDHMKGPVRKDAKHSKASDYVIPPYSRVNFNGGRYGQIPDIIRAARPSTILEIGTWSGWRAIQMALVALESGGPVHYKGFDVFEEYSTEFDSREMNVKPHFSKAEITRLLSLLVDIYPEFSFELVQGNTNDTLRHEKADFVFLDGGHSVATIQHDFDAVRESKLVLLDDYYTGPIDTQAFGCNAVLSGEQAYLLPKRDPVAGGGFTQFAVTCGNQSPPAWVTALQPVATA